MVGWGAHQDDFLISDRWSAHREEQYINVLELGAVKIALTSFLQVVHLFVILSPPKPLGGIQPNLLHPGLLVAHFENIGFYVGSSYSKYRLFTGFSIKNIG